MLPIAFDTDRDVIANALPTLGLVEPTKSKIVHISNTLHLSEVLVSEAYLPELQQRSDLSVLSGPTEMDFDADGNLRPVFAGH